MCYQEGGRDETRSADALTAVHHHILAPVQIGIELLDQMDCFQSDEGTLRSTIGKERNDSPASREACFSWSN